MRTQGKSMEDLPKHEDFKDSLVAFIDILGFDKRVQSIKSSEDFVEIGKLLYAAKSIAKNISEAKDIFDGFKITAVSDSIIITAPFSDPICTVGMLQLLHNIQYELLATNFKTLIRGYINRGYVYHRNGLLFGAGYSNAYHGEQFIGGAPRIVLAPDVVENAKRVIDGYSGSEKMITAFDFLCEDKNDGFYFVDYLKPVGNQSTLNKEQLLSERASVSEFIEEMLIEYRFNYKVLPKYKWLDNYFSLTSCYF